MKKMLSQLQCAERMLTQSGQAAAQIPDQDFMMGFPLLKYGINISVSSWGVTLTAPPALPRKENNCWAIIRQMQLWKRYFGWFPSVILPQCERYCASITHYSHIPFRFVPNTVETHALLNGLVRIFLLDDAPSLLDVCVRCKPAGDGPEGCEIKLAPLDERPASPRLPQRVTPHWEPREISDLFFELQQRDGILLPSEIMPFYRDAVTVNAAIRGAISYHEIDSIYILRRMGTTSNKRYSEILKRNPFTAGRVGRGGNFYIATNAPFRSREQSASDLFIDHLFRFILSRHDIKKRIFCASFDLEITQKESACDNDNIPFDMIHRLLTGVFSMSAQSTIRLRLDSQAQHQSTILFTPRRGRKMGIKEAE